VAAVQRFAELECGGMPRFARLLSLIQLRRVCAATLRIDLLELITREARSAGAEASLIFILPAAASDYWIRVEVALDRMIPLARLFPPPGRWGEVPLAERPSDVAWVIVAVGSKFIPTTLRRRSLQFLFE